jgi:hypothetical protein
MVMDRTGDGSHKADGTAAIDKPDPIRGKDFTESSGGGNKAWVTSLAGSAIDADAFDNAHYLDVALGSSARQGVRFSRRAIAFRARQALPLLPAGRSEFARPSRNFRGEGRGVFKKSARGPSPGLSRQAGAG